MFVPPHLYNGCRFLVGPVLPRVRMLFRNIRGWWDEKAASLAALGSRCTKTTRRLSAAAPRTSRWHSSTARGMRSCGLPGAKVGPSASVLTPLKLRCGMETAGLRTPTPHNPVDVPACFYFGVGYPACGWILSLLYTRCNTRRCDFLI